MSIRKRTLALMTGIQLLNLLISNNNIVNFTCEEIESCRKSSGKGTKADRLKEAEVIFCAT
jgi:hypothetical protein